MSRRSIAERLADAPRVGAATADTIHAPGNPAGDLIDTGFRRGEPVMLTWPTGKAVPATVIEAATTCYERVEWAGRRWGRRLHAEPELWVQTADGRVCAPLSWLSRIEPAVAAAPLADSPVHEEGVLDGEGRPF